jgi:hypothetical protein
VYIISYFRVLRRIFGRNREKVAGGWENYIMRSFMICTVSKIRMMISRRIRWGFYTAGIGEAE